MSGIAFRAMTVWLAVLAVGAAMPIQTSATNIVVRTLPRMYTPGVPITVTLSNWYDADGWFAYASERPPAGWTVTEVATNGFYYAGSTTNGAVVCMMRPLTGGGNGSNVFRYTIVAPTNESGIKTFYGYGVHGGRMQSTGGDQQIEYDANGDGIADGPPLNIRVSLPSASVSLCWLSVTNRSYQVQYTDSLRPVQWIDLGTNAPGTGITNCISDVVSADQPQRFYRLVEMPR